MYKVLFIIPIIALVLIVITFDTTDVIAQSEPNFLASVKAVITFEHNADITPIKNYYVNTVKPQAVDIINSYSTNIDDFSMQARGDDRVLNIIGFNTTTGKNIYQLYPKVVFFGDLPDGVNQTQFESKFHSFMIDMRIMLKNELLSNGATNISAHVHNITATVDG